MRLASTKSILLTSRIGNLLVCISVLWRAEHVRADVSFRAQTLNPKPGRFVWCRQRQRNSCARELDQMLRVNDVEPCQNQF